MAKALFQDAVCRDRLRKKRVCRLAISIEEDIGDIFPTGLAGQAKRTTIEMMRMGMRMGMRMRMTVAMAMAMAMMRKR